eukprot:15257512-Heterocapsa_arctica.AAC.1
MVKHPRKVRQIFPTMKCEHFSTGRWIHAITEGTGGAGLHMLSVYGYDTGKPEHATQHGAGPGSVRGHRRTRRGTLDHRRRLEQDARNDRKDRSCRINR